MEQQPSYFVQHHPCFPYLKNGLVLTALEMLHTLPCTTHVPPRNMLTIYHGSRTHDFMQTNAAAATETAPWIWAMRLMDESRLLCVYLDSDEHSDATMPWYPSHLTPHASGLMLRTGMPHAHHSVDISIVLDATHLEQMACALRVCRAGGVMIVHHSTDDPCIDELLYVLGTCFEESHVHVSNFVAPTPTSCHRVWMGIECRRQSPMVECIIDWLHRMQRIETTTDWHSIRSKTFAAWKSFLQQTMRHHHHVFKRRGTSATTPTTSAPITDACASEFFHAVVGDAVWTHVSDEVTHGTQQLQDEYAPWNDTYDSMAAIVRYMQSTWFPAVATTLGGPSSSPHHHHHHHHHQRDRLRMLSSWRLTRIETPHASVVTVASTCMPRLACLTQESPCTATWRIYTWRGVPTDESGQLMCSLPVGASFVALVTPEAFQIVDLLQLTPLHDGAFLSRDERKQQILAMWAHGTGNVIIRTPYTPSTPAPEHETLQSRWHIRYRC